MGFSERRRLVDPRQPRLGQGVTGITLLVGFVIDVPAVVPALAAVLGAAALLGPTANLYRHVYGVLTRSGLIGPPGQMEEAAPPRFANLVGFAVLTAASVALALRAEAVAWGLALLVAALALLAATSGLCVGCELYVLGRRLVTRGRIRDRVWVPRG